MRTTLAIADDVPAAAKTIARAQSRTVGDVVSEVPRRSVEHPASPDFRNGIRLLRVQKPETRVTLEIVNILRDEGP